MMRRHVWQTQIYFSRMLHGRGICRMAPPVIIAAAVTTTGDLACQCCLESSSSIDKRRLAVVALLGALLDGICMQRWYAVLHNWTGNVAQRLLLHHAAFAPPLIAVFLTATTSVSAQPERVREKLRHDWSTGVATHSAIVLPMQAANAWLVPRHYQVLVANSVALLWAVALSRLCHRQLPESTTVERTGTVVRTSEPSPGG